MDPNVKRTSAIEYGTGPRRPSPAFQPWPLDPTFETIAIECRRLAQNVNRFLMSLSRRDADARVHLSVEMLGNHFRKWNAEIIHLLATYRVLRYHQLAQRLPGISSRTLASKLARLQDDGLLARRVGTGRPPSVEYSLTANGYRLAQLMLPLIVFFNMQDPARVLRGPVPDWKEPTPLRP